MAARLSADERSRASLRGLAVPWPGRLRSAEAESGALLPPVERPPAAAPPREAGGGEAVWLLAFQDGAPCRHTLHPVPRGRAALLPGVAHGAEQVRRIAAERA